MRAGQTDDELIEIETRKTDRTYAWRARVDRLSKYVRSCAVCASALPPIDFLCPSCWRELGRLMNRGEALRQPDFVFPTYSLLTWRPETEYFVRPFIYAFKDGRAVAGAEKLAALFLSERILGTASSNSADRFLSTNFRPRDSSPGPVDLKPAASALIGAPARKFDHSALWAQVLSKGSLIEAVDPLIELKPEKARQKELRQGERGARRYSVREHFAKWRDDARFAKRIIFADDVITSGSTAMAAYMALGDPDRFEVWTLVARPRLAAKRGAC